MKRNPRMNRFPHAALCAVLSVFLFSLLFIPGVSADTPPATATVPPILQACAHATYPEARFVCTFPGAGSAQVPDGPPYTLECTDNSVVGLIRQCSNKKQRDSFRYHVG